MNLPAIDKLWKIFIDPKDWEKALELFPESPWELYLKPHGEYAAAEWDYFCKAVAWVWKSAERREQRQGGQLSYSFILAVNAIVMTGDYRNWRSSLRNYRPLNCLKSRRAIANVYRDAGVLYENPDGLTLRADGFWPAGKQSLDFFTSCRTLTLASTETDKSTWESALKHFQNALYPNVTSDPTQEQWHIYFPSHPNEIKAQLEAIIGWYQKRIDALQDQRRKTGAVDRAELLEVAVKVQRYLDITHFCMDGSGRTSRLIQDFTFLQFGLLPPLPVSFEYENEYFENGTYLPLTQAIQMTNLAWEDSH